MENRNTISGSLSVGKDADIAGAVNVQGKGHIKGNLRVDGWLDAPSTVGACKGKFDSEGLLMSAYPAPEPGWWATVGSANQLYTAYDGRWHDSGRKVENTVAVPLWSLEDRLAKVEAALSDLGFDEEAIQNALAQLRADSMIIVRGEIELGDTTEALDAYRKPEHTGLWKVKNKSGTPLGILEIEPDGNGGVIQIIKGHVGVVNHALRFNVYTSQTDSIHLCLRTTTKTGWNEWVDIDLGVVKQFRTELYDKSKELKTEIQKTRTYAEAVSDALDEYSGGTDLQLAGIEDRIGSVARGVIDISENNNINTYIGKDYCGWWLLRSNAGALGMLCILATENSKTTQIVLGSTILVGDRLAFSSESGVTSIVTRTHTQSEGFTQWKLIRLDTLWGELQNLGGGVLVDVRDYYKAYNGETTPPSVPTTADVAGTGWLTVIPKGSTKAWKTTLLLRYDNTFKWTDPCVIFVDFIPAQNSTFAALMQNLYSLQNRVSTLSTNLTRTQNTLDSTIKFYRQKTAPRLSKVQNFSWESVKAMKTRKLTADEASKTDAWVFGLGRAFGLSAVQNGESIGYVEFIFAEYCDNTQCQGAMMLSDNTDLTGRNMKFWFPDGEHILIAQPKSGLLYKTPLINASVGEDLWPQSIGVVSSKRPYTDGGTSYVRYNGTKFEVEETIKESDLEITTVEEDTAAVASLEETEPQTDNQDSQTE